VNRYARTAPAALGSARRRRRPRPAESLLLRHQSLHRRPILLLFPVKVIQSPTT